MPTLRLLDSNLTTLAIPPGRDREYFWDTERPGFGVVVGHKQRTFVVRGRVNGTGELVKRTIGVAGKPRPDGHLWTVRLARIAATEALGRMAGGAKPEPERRTSSGPTLRSALDLHVSEMRKAQCAERSIETIESEIPRLLGEHMDRPIADIKRSTLRELHDRLVADGKPFLARRIKAQVSAVWNTLEGASDEGLGSPNPASGWKAAPYVPSRERLDAQGLPAWYAKVQALSPVRRDLQLFCLFTGMRSEAARSVRWEHVNVTSKAIRVGDVDVPASALYVAKPKGGEERAFVLPLPATVVTMLKERRKQNADIFGPHGGDAGYAFPSLTRAAPFEVQPLAEPKEYRIDEAGKRAQHLPGLHVLRRTYLAVAQESGVTELDRSVLANHTYGRKSVNETYIKQAFAHLASEQSKIEAALWARLKPEQKRGKRGKAGV